MEAWGLQSRTGMLSSPAFAITFLATLVLGVHLQKMVVTTSVFHVPDIQKKERQITPLELVPFKEFLEVPPGDFCFHLTGYHYVVGCYRLPPSLLPPFLSIPPQHPLFLLSSIAAIYNARLAMNKSEWAVVGNSLCYRQTLFKKLQLLLNTSG